MPIHDWTRVDDGIFHDFHGTWIVELKRRLNSGVLPADFYALSEQMAGGLNPDVLTLERSNPSEKDNGDELGKSNGDGCAAIATAPPQVQYIAEATPECYVRKQRRIAIRHSSDDRVIAVIEIVSPGNKSSSARIRSFANKAIELLQAGIHLLVIDLFPPSRRDPEGIHGVIWSELCDDSFRLPKDKPLTLAAYSSGEVKRAYIDPVAVSGVLTEMPLFLEPEHYVPAPLESTYRAAFEAVPRRWRDVLEPRQ